LCAPGRSPSPTTGPVPRPAADVFPPRAGAPAPAARGPEHLGGARPEFGDLPRRFHDGGRHKPRSLRARGSRLFSCTARTKSIDVTGAGCSIPCDRIDLHVMVPVLGTGTWRRVRANPESPALRCARAWRRPASRSVGAAADPTLAARPATGAGRARRGGRLAAGTGGGADGPVGAGHRWDTAGGPDHRRPGGQRPGARLPRRRGLAGCSTAQTTNAFGVDGLRIDQQRERETCPR
jgi:hypothetical protein